MKKECLIIILILISASPVLAISTSLKQEYKPGETIIAEIFNVDNLKSEDILFYSGRAYIPMIYNVGKIQNKYYLYSILPDKERNYTLVIKKDSKFNFSVSGNLVSFSVNPGFIITNKDFEIKIKTYESTTIKSEFLNSSEEISLAAGREKILTFSVSDITSFTATTLTLSSENLSYNIPVAIFKESSKDIEIAKNLRFSKSDLDLTVLKDSQFQFEISIQNTGQENIENIYFLIENLEDIINLEPANIIGIEAGELKKINLIINSDKEGIREGTLRVYSENYTDEISIVITTIEDKEEFEEIQNQSEIIPGKSCDDLQGIKCKQGEVCKDNKIESSTDGSCCISECVKKSSWGLGKIISLIIIIIILLGIGFFLYKKFKIGTKTSKQVLKERSKSYEERFKSGSKEIRDSLSRT